MIKYMMHMAAVGLGLSAMGIDDMDRRPEHPNKRPPNNPPNPDIKYVEGRKRASKRKLRRERGKLKSKTILEKQDE